MEAIQWEAEVELEAAEAQRRHEGDRNTGTSTNVVQPKKFDGITSWVVFHCQSRSWPITMLEKLVGSHIYLTLCRCKLLIS
jgi:hypothetical protein